MICITGIPRTGKTSICNSLRKDGIDCRSADSIAEGLGCLVDGEVDLECLRARMVDSPEVIESHYSHLLNCDYVIILRTDTKSSEERMRLSNYTESKIKENLDAELADVIFYEALDGLPESRIFRVDLSGMDYNASVKKVKDKIKELDNLRLRD